MTEPNKIILTLGVPRKKYAAQTITAAPSRTQSDEHIPEFLKIKNAVPSAPAEAAQQEPQQPPATAKKPLLQAQTERVRAACQRINAKMATLRATPSSLKPAHLSLVAVSLLGVVGYVGYSWQDGASAPTPKLQAALRDITAPQSPMVAAPAAPTPVQKEDDLPIGSNEPVPVQKAKDPAIPVVKLSLDDTKSAATTQNRPTPPDRPGQAKEKVEAKPSKDNSGKKDKGADTKPVPAVILDAEDMKSSVTAVPKPVMVQEARKKAALVAITTDGKFALITNPVTRLPEKFTPGDTLRTGDKLISIDKAAGRVKTSAGELVLE